MSTNSMPIETQQIHIFISHKSQDRGLANNVRKTLEGMSDRLVCHVLGGNYSADYHDSIHKELQQSSILLLLFTSPTKSWDWPLYEVGLFTSFKEGVNRRVIYLYNENQLERPHPLEHLYGVCVVTEEVERFLDNLYRKSDTTGVVLPLNPELTDEDIAREARTICNEFQAASAIAQHCIFRLSLRTPGSQNKPFTEQPLLEIPRNFILEASESTLAIFNLGTGQYTWGDLIEANNTDPKWITGLDEAFQACLQGQLAAGATRWAFKAFSGTRMFRPAIYRIDKSGSRVFGIRIYFVEEYTPNKVGGSVFNLIRLATRFRNEVLVSFDKERMGAQSAEQKKDLMEELLNSLRAIEQEAALYDLLDEPSVLEAFSDNNEKETIRKLFAQWYSTRPQLEGAAQAGNFEQFAGTMNSLKLMNSEFLVLAAESYKVFHAEEYKAVSGVALDTEGSKRTEDVNVDREAIEKIIDTRISNIKKITYAFLAGIFLFFTIGIITPGLVLRPIIENIYPTQYIFNKNKERIAKDPSVISDIFNDANKRSVLSSLKSGTFEGVRFTNFPTLEKELPNEVWQAIKNGDRDRYNELMNERFTQALKARFYEDMKMTFTTYNPLNRELIRGKVREFGSKPLPARITTVASRHQGKSTNCNINFNHGKLHAIVVIPKKADKEKHYQWMKCPSAEFPTTKITIELNEGMRISEVKVVGVEWTGNSNAIELRLSKKTVENLEMNNWEKYLASGNGEFFISDASFKE